MAHAPHAPCAPPLHAGDFTPDMQALLAADIIICTPEKWDGISRNWQARSYVRKVRVLCALCTPWARRLPAEAEALALRHES